jgi:superfamily II DNA/RNA helicase
MRTRRVAKFAGPLAAGALVALLLLPGAAGARPHPASRRQGPEILQELSLFGTHGYEITVAVRNRRRLHLSASRLGGPAGAAGINAEGVSYTMNARQPRGSDSVVARIGRLGRIDLRFVADKVHREKPPHRCHGEPTLIEEGHFVGLVAFHGEGGYTEVHAHRAKGTIVRVPPLRCTPPPAPNLKKLKRELEKRAETEAEGGEEETEEEQEDDGSFAVKLTTTAHGHRVTFKAAKAVLKSKKDKKGFAFTDFIVTAARRRGRIEEESTVGIVFERGSTFLVPDRLHPASEAVLKPPAPFSGSATFRRHRDEPPTWTGDLKVDLLGFGSVRLAGTGTHASLCAGTACLL